MGMTCSSESQIKEPQHLVRLWIHESSRILHDRLIDKTDREWFYTNMMEILVEKLHLKWDKDDIFVKNKIRFTGIIDPKELTCYCDMKDTKDIVRRLTFFMKDYNDEEKNTTKQRLVFFDEAIDHILRILRILRQPGGNGMLIGIGGLGKQSLTYLASFILEYEVKELEIPRNFSMYTFKEWLKNNIILPCAGPDEKFRDGRSMTFMIVDNQISNDLILEIVNNILNSGEVQNLLPPEEKTQKMNALKEFVEDGKEELSNEQIYSKFIERVKNNLHLIM